MRKLLLLGFWLFSAVRGEHPRIQLSAQEGGRVEIPCRYDSGYETYPKYFYKGDYGKREIVVDTRGKKFKMCTEKGKCKLCDDTKQRILHVTINNLNLNDGGTYWCEIDAYTFDPKTEVQLEVYKAPSPHKPPPVPLNPPTVTAVRTNTRNQQQSATTAESKSAESSTSTPSAETHTVPSSLVSSAVGGKQLFLAAAAVLLLSLLVVLFFRLRKHRHDTIRVFGRDAGPPTNTSSRQLIHQGQQRELDPSVSVSSPDGMYAAVRSRRSPDDHTSVCHPVTIQTQMVHPEFDPSSSSRLQDDSSARIINQDKNICSVSRTSTEAGEQHISQDVHLVYSTVCFNTEGPAQPRGQIGSAAGPPDVYATVRRHKT